MESNWAAEHLQAIRTLMERSALYRRALAPVMTANGVLGALAAAIGLMARVEAPRAFLGYWMAVALAAVASSFLLARRQALKDAEPFWSPPTRRVAQALAPSLFFGFVLGLLLAALEPALRPGAGAALGLFWLPLVWIALYGCALHAAGFFMPRGMKIFGWALVLASSLLGAIGAFGFLEEWIRPPLFGHSLMGLVFGLAHLAYGIYLYFTERRGNEP
ncbi:MAG TPA: hypothetical protein VN829_00325 [Dongiaceae bacterium]|nr:hypothetical protein [Dongiaceae bacterium]